ncbi:MAG: pyridoxamine 5'-phosphate oxidase family protein [Burkholderiales bacterium]|nr:pyridoxamine 5'-phosphate oxidase family protein [Burkholderiales bacterium]
MNDMTDHLIRSVAQLREYIAEPSALVQAKIRPALDVHMRAFIALSPWVDIGSYGADGRVDVSPRGDPAGFVHVLADGSILIPERPGNRRADTLRNIIETGHVGLLFAVPGRDELLRINGRAVVSRNPEWLERLVHQGKQPQFAIHVEVEEAYLHCGRAANRSKLWRHDTWPAPDALPSMAQMLVDQTALPGLEVSALGEALKDLVTNQLY